MIKLFKIHLVYFFSKKNIILLVVCLLLALIISVVVVVDNNNMSMSIKDSNQYSWNELYSFFKIIVISLSCFLMNSFSISNNDNYKVLFIINLKKPRLYYLSKVLTVYLVQLCIVLMLLIIFLSISIICNNSFIMEIDYIKGFWLLYSLSVVYGSITLLISKIFDNTMCIIVPFLLYFISELFELNSVFVSTFFPNFLMLDVQNAFLISSLHSIFLVVFYTVFYFLMVKK